MGAEVGAAGWSGTALPGTFSPPSLVLRGECRRLSADRRDSGQRRAIRAGKKPITSSPHGPGRAGRAALLFSKDSRALRAASLGDGFSGLLSSFAVQPAARRAQRRVIPGAGAQSLSRVFRCWRAPRSCEHAAARLSPGAGDIPLHGTVGPCVQWGELQDSKSVLLEPACLFLLPCCGSWCCPPARGSDRCPVLPSPGRRGGAAVVPTKTHRQHLGERWGPVAPPRAFRAGRAQTVEPGIRSSAGDFTGPGELFHAPGMSKSKPKFRVFLSLPLPRSPSARVLPRSPCAARHRPHRRLLPQRAVVTGAERLVS